MIDQSPGPSGWMALRMWRHGTLVEDVRLPNLVVAGSKLIHAQLVGGVTAGNSITQVGFGSNPLAPIPGNNGLSVDAYIKALDAISYPAPNQVSFDISLAAVEGNGLSLSEYGLLTAAGALYSRLVRTAPLIKDASISIQATWTISF
jgi:hypothetical protein